MTDEQSKQDMKFEQLPVEVQIIAAQTLKGKMDYNDLAVEKEPVKKLAQEVREAFIELHSPS